MWPDGCYPHGVRHLQAVAKNKKTPKDETTAILWLHLRKHLIKNAISQFENLLVSNVSHNSCFSDNDTMEAKNIMCDKLIHITYILNICHKNHHLLYLMKIAAILWLMHVQNYIKKHRGLGVNITFIQLVVVSEKIKFIKVKTPRASVEWAYIWCQALYCTLTNSTPSMEKHPLDRCGWCCCFYWGHAHWETRTDCWRSQHQR